MLKITTKRDRGMFGAPSLGTEVYADGEKVALISRNAFGAWVASPLKVAGQAKGFRTKREALKYIEVLIRRGKAGTQHDEKRNRGYRAVERTPKRIFSLWPFRRDQPPHELGDDPKQIITALKARRQWKGIPDSSWKDIRENVAYVFDRPGEDSEALRNTVLVAEKVRILSRLAPESADPEPSDAHRMSLVSLDLKEKAVKLALEIQTAKTDKERTRLLFLADSSAVASLVFDRYQLESYLVVASMSLDLGANRVQARLWCARYRKAEKDLLSQAESDLTTVQRALKEMLVDPTDLQRVGEAMRRYLPSGAAPAFDEAQTPRDWLAQVEARL